MVGTAKASVQVEDGYSRVAHPILEAMAAAGFTASQYAVLLVLVRETYGWGRRDAQVSLGAFSDKTRSHKTTVQRALQALVDEGVVTIIEPASFSAPATYRIEKDARKWGKYAVNLPPIFSAREQVAPTQGGSVDAYRGGSVDAYRGGSVDATSQRSQGVVANEDTRSQRKRKKGKERYTEGKPSEAGPRGLVADAEAEGGTDRPAAPLPPNSNDGDPGEAEELDLPAIRAQLAPAIRKHLWLGDEVPHLVALSKPGWNMGRELNIATGFIERGEATVEELIGAMKYARHVLHHAEVKPISMLAFNGKGRRDRLNEAIALWRREQMKKRFHEHAKQKAVDEVMAGFDRGERATA